MHFFVGITGASGVRLGARFVEILASYGVVHLCVTPAAVKIAAVEGVELSFPPQVAKWPCDALDAPVSSGSFRLHGTIIIPCSMGTLGRIVGGISSSLVERAADVAVKEGWPLVLVPRETPLSVIHLENLISIAKAGAVILPPVLTYYHGPCCMEEMENFILGKILDRLGLEHNLFRRWGDEA
jgi:4-hydroxy-3-polyprenylbenzoate decarboxylase